jgi:hypothetical protein
MRTTTADGGMPTHGGWRVTATTITGLAFAPTAGAITPQDFTAAWPITVSINGGRQDVRRSASLEERLTRQRIERLYPRGFFALPTPCSDTLGRASCTLPASRHSYVNVDDQFSTV